MSRGLIGTGLVVVALATSVANAQSTVSFLREMPDIQVGLSPNAVTTADFNNDKKIDIAIANSDSDDVSILLGNGDGTFLDSGATLPVDFAPVAIAVGDFNHDDKPDIITANEIGNSVSVLLNQTVDPGAVTFGANVTTDTGDSPEAVVVGDFDDDMFPDVATADNFDDTVTILKGVGDGSFTQPQSIAVGSAPMGLATGFINSDDQFVDLVVTNSAGGADGSGTLTVLKGMGGDVFEPQTEILLNCGTAADLGCVPVAVAVAKVDSGDTLDLVVVNEEADNVSILLGDGDLSFSAAGTASVGSFPAFVVAADFDGDGKTDIATSSNFEDKVSVLIGLGNGMFMPSQDFGVGMSPSGIAADKFNADDKPDLVTANQDDETVSILINSTGAAACVGDCDGIDGVGIAELLTMVNIALGNAPVADCSAGDPDGSGDITIDEILTAVNNALNGCPQ